MRLWANIYDASDNLLGAGPVLTLQSASVSRVLDGAGSFQMGFPATDEDALALVQNERRVRLYAEMNDVTRELGRGVIRSKGLNVSESGYMVTVTGPDSLDALTRASVLLGRKYTDEAVSDIVDGLIALVGGWSATVDAGLGNLSARFDGVSVLKALLTLAEQQGLHIREGETANTLEVGVFGTVLVDDAGSRVVVYGPVQAGLREIQGNDALILIESLSQTEQSDGVVNWIIPLGAGEGEAALTLEKSTRTEPYTIQNMVGPDGRTLYYLEDETSTALYGDIQKIVVLKNIAPISTDTVDIERAANALYDAAAAWLERQAVQLTSYSFSCRKPAVTVRPGDKIRVTYKGVVEKTSGLLTYADINDDFWVMRVTEALGQDGLRLQLEVSTIDRVSKDAAQVIVGALEAIEIRNTAIQSYYTKSGTVYRREIDPTHTATVPIFITNATQSVERVLLRFQTRPFRATSMGSAAGGNHNHRMFTKTANYYAIEGYSGRVMEARNGDGGFISDVILINASNVDLWTEGSSGTHIHAAEYGIYDDTEYPDTVSVAINGVDRTVALGGPWGAGGVEAIVEVNITDYIRAEGTLHKVHTVTFSCDDGQGEVEAMIELYEIIQSIAAM